MKFLVVFKIAEGKSMDDVAPLMVDEIKEVWRSYQEGSLREFYFSPKRPAVVLIYEADDEAAVEIAVSRLPMVKESVLSHETFELAAFSHLQALFDMDLMEQE
ncbi:hypothetical protein [Halopseudomonas pelagia]|uniref:hypothetical protein n=1 Tax=Halopseudomonas pelagia TaxID=553151 RepID=UPI0030D9384F|tara:strand:+ start:1222 stop:1530 length:309 start_codon:yes stop_codon:yes gene_type:complete